MSFCSVKQAVFSKKPSERQESCKKYITMSRGDSSSSSSAPSTGNAKAKAHDAVQQNQPPKITADNVLVRYKGTFEKWGRKIADLDREILDAKTRNLEKGTVSKMLASQVRCCDFRLLEVLSPSFVVPLSLYRSPGCF